MYKMATINAVLLFTYSLVVFYAATHQADFQHKAWYQNNFTFENCNRSAVPFYVTRLKILPDPVKLGVFTILMVHFDLDRDVGVDKSRVEVDLNLRLKTDRGYTELCDIIGEDKCHYNDLCNELNTLMKRNFCPKFMWNDYQNNCSCPFRKNSYSIRPVPLLLPELPFQLRGTFNLTVNLQEQDRHLGCLRVQFCITSCKPLGAE